MKTNIITVDINLNVYESKLRGEIASDFSALENSLLAIDNPLYKDKKFELKQGITLVEISVPHLDFFLQREINKCFKSVVGSLQDYLDNLIAVTRFKNEKISFPSNVTQTELNHIIENGLSKNLLEVSFDRSLTTPEKLKIIFGKIEHCVYMESVQSYFDVRNGLEHHKGIAKADRTVRYKRMGLASTTGDEISAPDKLAAGEGLVIKSFDEEIKYDKGGQLIITKTQLDSLIISLLIFIIPQIQTVVSEKINEQTSSPLARICNP